MTYEVAVPMVAVPVTTSEAVVAALPQIAEQIPNAYGFIIEGEVNYSPAATGTAITLGIRQTGVVGGALVGVKEVANALANPNSYGIPFSQIFPAGAAVPYGNQFCLTAQGTTAGGTINNGTLKCRALNPTGTP